MVKSSVSKGLIETVRLEREKNPQAKAADIARILGKSREATRRALVELGLPSRLSLAKICVFCGKKLPWGNKAGRCRGCFTDPEVKDAVVRDYLRGDKPTVIQSKHKISSGVMYRILHTQNVKLKYRRLS